MKLFLTLLCIVAGPGIMAVSAQEKTADPTPDKPAADIPGLPEKPTGSLPEKPADLAPTGPVAPKPNFTEPLPLIPDIVPPTDRPNSLSGQKSEAKRARSKVEGTLQERIHYRDLKTRILADGVLQQQWDLAQRARTDAGKREGLKKYYTMFFDRMEKLDPAMKPKIDRRRTLVFHSLEQRRIKSSELIEELESETGEMPLEAGTLRASDTAD